MYIVKLAQLLRAFHISEQNGLVHLEPLHVSAEEPWIAYLHLHHGEIASCNIHSKNDGRILLQNTNALQWIDTKEGFLWNLEATVAPMPRLPQPSSTPLPPDTTFEETEHTSENVPPPEPSRQTQTPFPVRQVLPERQEAPVPWMPERAQESIPMTWPRAHTRVFALTDGLHTIEQIAGLLHISPERVLLILRELQAKRVVK